MKNVYLMLILVTSLLGILSCGKNSVAGGNGSETGNPVIYGTASLSSGHSVDSLTLIVRKQNSVEADSIYPYLGDEFDEYGQLQIPAADFDFTLSDTGAYIVELRSGDSLAAVQYVTVLADRPYELQEMYLDTLLEITGAVKLVGGDSTDVYIYAQGIDRTAVAASDGSFRLAVPRGLISLEIVPQSNLYNPVEIPYLQAGTAVELIRILAKQPVSTDYEGDSLIVRAILDSNGLYSIGVEQVTVAQDNRIIEFDVAADASQPDKVTISGQIVTIPSEIGGLSALEELEIQYTTLTLLPEAIGLLTSLKDLELNDNNLTSLPESIVNLTPTGELRLSRNLLKLTDAQRAWADEYDPDWEVNQQ